jgi:DNA-binding IclR family transcriptional regulator
MEPKTTIASVTKALNVLSEIARQPNGAGAKEVADALSMPVPTTYHLLNTLTVGGALTKGADRRYRLGPRVGALSAAYYEQTELDEHLLAPMRDLAESTGESVYISGWRGADIEVFAVEEGSHAVRVTGLERGAHGFAHARASGKLLLALAPPEMRDAYLSRHELLPRTAKTITDSEALRAELEAIASQRYAIDDEEFTVGVGCVAVPLEFGGLSLGAYTISAPIERFQLNRTALTEAALQAAKRVNELADDRKWT